MKALLDQLKTVVGDDNNDRYSDDEYRGFIERRLRFHTRTDAQADLIEDSSPNRWMISRSRTPVYKLEVADKQGNTYNIGEYRGIVELASGSDSRDPLDVTYLRVEWEHILADVYEALASDEAKVAILQESGGFDMDLRQLANHLWKQSERWRSRARAKEGAVSL